MRQRALALQLASSIGLPSSSAYIRAIRGRISEGSNERPGAASRPYLGRNAHAFRYGAERGTQTKTFLTTDEHASRSIFLPRMARMSADSNQVGLEMMIKSRSRRQRAIALQLASSIGLLSSSAYIRAIRGKISEGTNERPGAASRPYLGRNAYEPNFTTAHGCERQKRR
jgi:hypothetical protein